MLPQNTFLEIIIVNIFLDCMSDKKSPARIDGRAEEAPYTAVHAADVGSDMQLLRLEHVASEHFPIEQNWLYNTPEDWWLW